MSETLTQAVSVTCELLGQQLSDPALAQFVRDLQPYGEPAVLVALDRSRKELRRLTLADVLDRLPGQHPGAEEAWAIVAPTINDEGASVVWTDEIAEAWGTVSTLQEDPIAMRMAFKEAYARVVAKARQHGRHPRWRASLGTDVSGRVVAVTNAVLRGQLTQEAAQRLLPNDTLPDITLPRLPELP